MSLEQEVRASLESLQKTPRHLLRQYASLLGMRPLVVKVGRRRRRLTADLARRVAEEVLKIYREAAGCVEVHGTCASMSLLLRTALLDQGFVARYVEGSYRSDKELPVSLHWPGHYWIEAKTEDQGTVIVDATISQYRGLVAEKLPDVWVKPLSESPRYRPEEIPGYDSVPGIPKEKVIERAIRTTARWEPKGVCEDIDKRTRTEFPVVRTKAQETRIRRLRRRLLREYECVH